MSDDEVELIIEVDTSKAVESLRKVADKATVLGAPFKTHYFEDTGTAYDKTQTGYYRFKELPSKEMGVTHYTEPVYTEVKDGDLLVVPKKGVYGFLYEAWPIAYVPEEKRNSIDALNEASGELHTLVGDTEEFFKSNPKYKEVWEAAKQLYELHHNEMSRTDVVKRTGKTV